MHYPHFLTLLSLLSTHSSMTSAGYYPQLFEPGPPSAPPIPPPTLDLRRDFTAYITRGISETRDVYLGAEIINVQVGRRPGEQHLSYTLNLLWESPQRQYFEITTTSHPTFTGPTWDPPEEMGKPSSSKPGFNTFEWEDVVRGLELDMAITLMRSKGYTAPYSEVSVFRPGRKVPAATSRLFYQFSLVPLEEGHRVFVGVEDHEVLGDVVIF